MTSPRVIFRSFDPAGRGWESLAFGRPETVVAARQHADVPAVLALAESAAAAGKWAVLLVTYEAATAFDPAFRTHAPEPAGLPLAWVALFPAPLAEIAARHEAEVGQASFAFDPWQPAVVRAEYAAAIRQVRDYIAAGDTYQVNYTFPLRSRFRGDALAAWRAMSAAQGAGYSAFLDLGSHQVLSFSPELFFKRAGDELTLRPMKGTLHRGRFPAEDRLRVQELAASEKNRAENLMILDMVRNDAGRIAVTGSVHVPRMFEVERYRTVLQMTSTVKARIRPGVRLPELFAALFPCASITGAPKVRTLEIIRELEPFPRGLYTGAIGLVRPGGAAEFSVAIRTVVRDPGTGAAVFGVGGGITWDSTAAGEYDECMLKAAFLTLPAPAFDLLESLLLEDGTLFLLERHLHRMRESADYFGLPWPEARVRTALEQVRNAHPAGAWKVRLLLGPEGLIRSECAALAHSAAGGTVWRVALADAPVDSQDTFLFHKTTRRAVYDAARKSHPEADDVILWNERGELTESCFANLVLDLGSERLTPPLACGLLAGTFRQELLESGQIRERVLTREDLRRAAAVHLINSVRRWIRVRQVD